MKILHYTLGLPPYRTGGLTKYSLDLMKSEMKIDNEVYLLYPGKFNISKKTKIIKNKSKYNIKIYEIINPLPVPLLGGINQYNLYTNKIDKKVYLEFLRNINPSIIHIHTIMGLHKEFLDAAKDLEIKIIYTTHDYFGICPKVNLIDFNGEICLDYQNGKKCILCNQHSYSIKMIFIMQSKLYRYLKNMKIITKIRSYKKNEKKEIKLEKDIYNDRFKSKDYINLRNYYIEMLNLVDYIHFNSSIAKNEYEKYMPNLKGKILNITHIDIKNNYINKKFIRPDDKLKISYLGPLDKYKGFYLLKDSLEELLNRGIKNWELNMYGSDCSIELDSKYYKIYGRYEYKDLANIFENTDVLVVPSIWKETFGFIGLEALSYGIPVIVSEHVGLRDIIELNNVGIVFNANPKDLSDLIEKIINDRMILHKLNENIVDREVNITMNKHTSEIIDLYNDIIMERV